MTEVTTNHAIRAVPIEADLGLLTVKSEQVLLACNSL